jgi:hypothetical protein
VRWRRQRWVEQYIQYDQLDDEHHDDDDSSAGDSHRERRARWPDR